MLPVFYRLLLVIFLFADLAKAQTSNGETSEPAKVEGSNATVTTDSVESQAYTFKYATAEVVVPLLCKELLSGVEPTFELHTNTITYHEFKSNHDKIRKFLDEQDKPVRQFMMEARLVEIKTESLQNYGIDWRHDYLKEESVFKNAHVILTVPQVSRILRKLNEDADTEFLANPRIVTGEGKPATFKLSRKQLVPQLNFNERSARVVYGGFDDNDLSHALSVIPAMSSPGEITLQIQPIPGRKQGERTYTPPVIPPPGFQHVLKSGDTLGLFNLFEDPDQVHTILVFITPTLLKPAFKEKPPNSSEEYADPNGWRNNAKSGIRKVPTPNTQLPAAYPLPFKP